MSSFHGRYHADEVVVGVLATVGFVLTRRRNAVGDSTSDEPTECSGLLTQHRKNMSRRKPSLLVALYIRASKQAFANTGHQ